MLLKKFENIIHTWLGKAFKGHLKLFNRINCQVSHSLISILLILVPEFKLFVTGSNQLNVV